ncbi:MAG: cell wall hydrolase [Lachnospiraceae bacterium]|nr:cell wall hydrolase [Lachnospiraceae bacterium]
MNKLKNRLIAGSLLLAVGFVSVAAESVAALALEKDHDFPSAGAATLLNLSGNGDEVGTESDEPEEKLNITDKFNQEEERIMSELAMANVTNTLNVREEASEDSDKVGYLYRDCGGTILERKDGWTKIRSGALTGWCSDEYLLFGDEAVEMARDVGRWLVTLDSEAVRVRTEPSTDADIMALLAKGDYADFVEIINDDWISVDYGGDLGYINTAYINISLHIDAGETVEAVKMRQAIEEEMKRKAAEEENARLQAEFAKERKKNRGAVAADADELRLLGALIYCEAGNQTYDGMVAVGAVVMNRVKSPAYPNTIYSVIYASGQFSPAMSGKVATVYLNGVPETCLMAAAAAINGETTVGAATHFRRNNGHEGYVLGDHVFW